MKDTFYLIINYDKSSTCHYHITHMFDYLTSLPNTKYFYIEYEELITHSSNVEDLNIFFISKFNQILNT